MVLSEDAAGGEDRFVGIWIVHETDKESFLSKVPVLGVLSIVERNAIDTLYSDVRQDAGALSIFIPRRELRFRQVKITGDEVQGVLQLAGSRPVYLNGERSPAEVALRKQLDGARAEIERVKGERDALERELHGLRGQASGKIAH